MEPERIEAQLGLAVSLLHVDKAEAAAERFERVLASQPDDPTALFGKAVTLQLRGQRPTQPVYTKAFWPANPAPKSASPT